MHRRTFVRPAPVSCRITQLNQRGDAGGHQAHLSLQTRLVGKTAMAPEPETTVLAKSRYWIMQLVAARLGGLGGLVIRMPLSSVGDKSLLPKHAPVTAIAKEGQQQFTGPACLKRSRLFR